MKKEAVLVAHLPANRGGARRWGLPWASPRAVPPNHPATRHQNKRTPRDTGSTIKSDEERGALGGMGGARDKYENPDETRSRHDRNLPGDT